MDDGFLEPDILERLFTNNTEPFKDLRQELSEEYLKVSEQLTDIAKNSNCIHRKVGALLYNPITKEIVSTGYNYTPEDPSPCIINNSCTKHNTGKCPVIHAEVNCVLNLLKNKRVVDFSELVFICIYSPCYECSKVIVSLGIKEFYYWNKHHRTDWEYLKANGVILTQLEKRVGGADVNE